MQDVKRSFQVSKLVLVMRSMECGIAWVALQTSMNESGGRIEQEMIVVTVNLLQPVR